MTTTPKINKNSLLAEAFRLLREVGPVAGQQPAPASPPAPPSAPQQAQPPAVDPANPSPPPPATPGGQSVEDLVNSIDQLRAGKSLSEPAAYQALSQWYDTLQPQEQQSIQTGFAKLAEILSTQPTNDPTQDQAQNTRGAQQAPPPPSPVPGAGGTGMSAPAGGTPVAAI